MEKSLGFRLMDCIKEVGELEASITELSGALFIRKVKEVSKEGIDLIKNNINSCATLYNVNIEDYSSRIMNIESEYSEQINKLRDEYEVQFINSQLELRDVLTSQKVTIVNAKRTLDAKKEMNSNSQYDAKIDELLKRYFEYDNVAKKCEEKINKCLSDLVSEIEGIVKDNITTAITTKNENAFSKFFNKIKNIFSGKSKFEAELSKIENNISGLSSVTDSKIEIIRNDTLEFVKEVSDERNLLNSKVA